MSVRLHGDHISLTPMQSVSCLHASVHACLLTVCVRADRDVHMYLSRLMCACLYLFYMLLLAAGAAIVHWPIPPSTSWRDCCRPRGRARWVPVRCHALVYHMRVCVGICHVTCPCKSAATRPGCQITDSTRRSEPRWLHSLCHAAHACHSSLSLPFRRLCP